MKKPSCTKFSMVGLDLCSEIQNSNEAYLSYIELVSQVATVFTKIALNQFIVSDCMSAIVYKVYGAYQHYLEFVIGAKPEIRGLAKNAVDTAILAAALATRKGFSFSNTYKVIESALLHDVGMLCIPPEILNKQGSLSKNEYWYILIHPIQGYKLISEELTCFEGVSQIALQHHENWNGEGYPKRLAGTKIQQEARIVAVADAFSAMVSERSYRGAIGGHEAMKKLLADNTARFDPEMLKLFVHIMGIYPIGSLVELNNGTIAQVITYEEDMPLLKPRIRLLANAAGELYMEDQTLDLVHEKGLFIKNEVNRWEILEAYKGVR